MGGTTVAAAAARGLQGLLDLLVRVGGDNWADHRSFWDLHSFYRGHHRHSSWDSGHRSSQDFLLKPEGAGQILYVRSSHQDSGAGHITTAPSSRPKPPRARLHAPNPSDPTAPNGAA